VATLYTCSSKNGAWETVPMSCLLGAQGTVAMTVSRGPQEGHLLSHIHHRCFQTSAATGGVRAPCHISSVLITSSCHMLSRTEQNRCVPWLTPERQVQEAEQSPTFAIPTPCVRPTPAYTQALRPAKAIMLVPPQGPRGHTQSTLWETELTGRAVTGE
jgi:hypothetical protein